MGRNAHPSAAIVDSQSAKTTGVGGEQRGYDGGEKVHDRKRHLLVDAEGLVLKAKVHSAKIPDQDGLKLLLNSARTAVPQLKRLWLDAGYDGRGKRWVEYLLNLSVETVRRPPKPIPEELARRWTQEWAMEGQRVEWQKLMPPRGFVVLPRRWVVERTFSWLDQNRRMSKDYERLCATSLGDSVKEELRGSLPSGTVGGTLQSPNVREVDPTAKHFYRSLVLQIAEGTGYGHLFAPIMVPRGSWV